MNREYLIIRIALGKTTAESNNIVLTEEEKERIKRYQEESAKAKKEGRKLVWFAPDED
ncbi:hypothetical protein [Anaerococcus degeneri]|uniref:Uncharacterized protein n=1 Tax=Anaerococcus degeneri TaxID=361500 RepID=A0ABS7YY54_9FIRM|nr:hypothetical protein [Anaerococcus degeneri]MBP2016144.1 citrate lyase synthetase [Anaerococcus degeneri]MCA2096651.1 hypothetical protein [Anaerococcus degeneri]